MQAEFGAEWKALYRFDLQPQLPVDYEAINWYLAGHPDSYFVNTLVAARPGVDCRYALENNRFTVHRGNGESERRSLRSAAELRQVLEDDFGIALDNLPELDSALERLVPAEGAE